MLRKTRSELFDQADSKINSEERNIAWFQYKTNRTDEHWESYRKLRNKVTSLIKEDKLQQQFKLMTRMEKNPKLLYQFVNAQAKVKPGISAIKTESGMTANAFETANALATFYASVFSPEDTRTPIQTVEVLTDETLSDVHIDRANIVKHLRGLQVHTSPGGDGVTPLLLRHCAEPLSYPLAKLFASSLEEELVPEDWKCGIIAPIFKGASDWEVLTGGPVDRRMLLGRRLGRRAFYSYRSSSKEVLTGGPVDRRMLLGRRRAFYSYR
ncbi:hypothetical protein T265_04194 [Opisthorchis viverrini]|uniref:Reverse transcriptase domain-containing protein n=1 Tax=Opisthorchis viverrini TaxID=6198 RepID=A0A075AGV6_OPIVI|nr:hypothetical protein T265_04194 [Opisthorchis viverrini]KER29104.1 hypothetical protein T265_04194 [Opisthorchis viverrini]